MFQSCLESESGENAFARGKVDAKHFGGRDRADMSHRHFHRCAKPGTRMRQGILERKQSLRCESSDNDPVLKDSAWQIKAITANGVIYKSAIMVA